MNEEQKAKKCPRCGNWNVSNDLYCRTCWFKFEDKINQSMEGKTNSDEPQLFTSGEIDELARIITNKFSPKMKDRLLKDLPPEYKDRLVEFMMKDLLPYFSRNPETFVTFAREVAQRYEKTEMRKGGKIPRWLKQWRELEKELNLS